VGGRNLYVNYGDTYKVRPELRRTYMERKEAAGAILDACACARMTGTDPIYEIQRTIKKIICAF